MTITRENRVELDSDLYAEPYLAMMEHRQHDGCYIMQYSERQDTDGKVAVFLLREAE